MSAKFDGMYMEFITQLKNCFPKLMKNVQPEKDRQYGYMFEYAKHIIPYIDEIAIGNVDIFLHKYKRAQIVRGVAFKKVLENSPKELIDAIMNYMRDLFFEMYDTSLLEKVCRKINDEHNAARMDAINSYDRIKANFLHIDVQEDVPELS